MDRDKTPNPDDSQPKTAPELDAPVEPVAEATAEKSEPTPKAATPVLTQPPAPPTAGDSDAAEPRHSEAKIRTVAFVMVAMLGLAAGFLGGYLGSRSEVTPTTIEKQQVVMQSQGDLISSIAESVGPSVVSIEVISTATQESLFGTSRQVEQQSAGTGVIISKDGLIMTNRHVVDQGTTAVNVTLSDGTKFEDVTVVGRTSSSDVLDVAFLKIKDLNGKKLTVAKIGDSSKMKIGSSVVAIGNALGQFENTVTSGIISGHGRSIQASNESGGEVENLEDLFQTDAAINQGNSGGPLVNINGEVIGLNTAVASGDAQSIGFAIPINNLKGLIDGVIATGKVERPYLGVMYLSLTDDVAAQYGLSVKRGAYIAPEAIVGSDPVINNGPADKAGIKAGDVIVKVDGQAIDEDHSLTSLLGKKSVGDKVELTVMRDGKETRLTATLAAAPQS